MEYLKSRGLPATAEISRDAVQTSQAIIVVDSSSSEQLVLESHTRAVSHIIDYDGLAEVEALLLLVGECEDSFLFSTKALQLSAHKSSLHSQNHENKY